MPHSCADCGLDHEAPEPVVIEPDPEPAIEAAGESAVEVARIESERDIKLAKLQASVDRAALDARLGELEAELRGQREILGKLMPPPPPEPAPVVVEEAEPETEMPPRAEKESAPRKSPSRRGFFG